MSSSGQVFSSFSEFVQGEHLSLHNQGLQDSAMSALLDFLDQNPTIKSLDLSSNLLGPKSIKEFAVRNRSITKANFSYNPIHSEGIGYFAKQNTCVLDVDFSHAGIDGGGTYDFAWYNHKVIRINLSWNHLGNRGIREFARWNRDVTQANFSATGLSDVGVGHFVAHNTTVNSVDFSWNDISNCGATALMKSRNLFELQLDENHISAAVLKKLQTQIAFNGAHRRAWMATSLLIAGYRANAGSALAHSLLPLFPLILKFSASPGMPQAEQKQGGDLTKTGFFTRHFLLPAPTLEQSSCQEEEVKQSRKRKDR